MSSLAVFSEKSYQLRNCYCVLLPRAQCGSVSVVREATEIGETPFELSQHTEFLSCFLWIPTLWPDLQQVNQIIMSKNRLRSKNSEAAKKSTKSNHQKEQNKNSENGKTCRKQLIKTFEIGNRAALGRVNPRLKTRIQHVVQHTTHKRSTHTARHCTHSHSIKLTSHSLIAQLSTRMTDKTINDMFAHDWEEHSQVLFKLVCLWILWTSKHK